MITKGTSGSQAELAIELFDTTGAPVTGHVWLTSDAKIRFPGGTLAALTVGQVARIVEIGGGYYVLQLSAAETAATGTVVFVLQAGSSYLQYARSIDIIDPTVGSAGSLVEVPIYLFDASGVAVTAHTWLTTDAKIRFPGGALGDLSSSQVSRIVELGDGYYVLQLDTAETAALGAVFFLLENGSSYLPHAWSTDIIAASGDVITNVTVIVAGAAPTTEPVPSPYVTSAPDYYDIAAIAVDRLCEYAKAKAA